MSDNRRVVKTSDQSNDDIEIIDAIIEPATDDDEILELDNTQELNLVEEDVLEVSGDTEELDLSNIQEAEESLEKTEQLELGEIQDSDVDKTEQLELGDISSEEVDDTNEIEPQIVSVLEPTGVYKSDEEENVEDSTVNEVSSDVKIVDAENGSVFAVEEENVTAAPVSIKKVNKIFPKKYLDYKVRVAIMGVILVALFGLYLVFFVSSLSKPEEEVINYKETSNLDYKVYLKQNDFYESDYLDKNMVYVASLIDNIAIDFNYKFLIDEQLSLDLSYDVVGKLIISDTDGKKRYFEKEYELLKKKNVDVSKVNNYNLKETVLVDYDYYNSLANQFKMNYGVEAKSTLQIFLKVNKKSKDSIYNINDDSVMSITIPLSTKSVEIEMNYNEIDENRTVVKESIDLVHNKVYMALAIVFGLSMIVVAIKLLRFLSLTKVKKSVYDNYIEKILKEYDRLIVENFTGPDLKNCSVVTIKNFDELLDVRDGLKLPVLYYVVAKHQKCYFYVKNDNEIYLLTIKAVDLEKENEKR